MIRLCVFFKTDVLVYSRSKFTQNYNFLVFEISSNYLYI